MLHLFVSPELFVEGVDSKKNMIFIPNPHAKARTTHIRLKFHKVCSMERRALQNVQGALGQMVHDVDSHVSLGIVQECVGDM